MIYIIFLVVGFVFGILVGRTNKNKVEVAYNVLKQEYELLKEKIKEEK
jgi:uncharacterized membrane-anchored protein YhcB (DUF1043 family)